MPSEGLEGAWKASLELGLAREVKEEGWRFSAMRSMTAVWVGLGLVRLGFLGEATRLALPFVWLLRGETSSSEEDWSDGGGFSESKAEDGTPMISERVLRMSARDAGLPEGRVRRRCGGGRIGGPLGLLCAGSENLRFPLFAVMDWRALR